MTGLDPLWNAVRPGRTVYLPGAAGESIALAQALRGDPKPNAGTSPLSCLGPRLSETLDYASLAPDCRVTTNMLPRALRSGFHAGGVSLLPLTYWAMARLLAAMRCDVAVAHVAPPDGRGLCSLGISSDFTPLVWPNAACKVLLVNPSMPAIPRAPALPLAAADVVVTLDGPLVEAPPSRSDPEAEVIAARVATLIPDGAHVQTGIGGAPGAIWRHLRDHRGLILRSGMANDWLLDLREAGALAPDGAHLAAMAYGSRRFYEDLARSDLVGFASVDRTHGLPELAQAPLLHSVNSALEVDLFGQVNVEWQGDALSGGVGRAPDFMRGAGFSPGGRSIVALPSTAKGGTLSRIVTRIGKPAVGIARSDIDTVVTENGVAELRAKGVDERAEAMIAIADPRFRKGLAEEWRALRQALV